MQYKLFPAFVLFLGSYLPLAIILAAQDIPFTWWSQDFCNPMESNSCLYNPFENAYLSIPFLVITIVASVLSWFSLSKQNFPFEIEVVSVKPIPNDIINYVFPYVVSFMGISYSSPSQLIGFFIFLLWMFAITYKSGQILMNPLLLMFGWHLFETKITINGNEREVRVLSHGNLLPGKHKSQTIQNFYIIRTSNGA